MKIKTRLRRAAVLSLSLVGMSVCADIVVDNNLPAGRIKVLSIAGDTVRVAHDYSTSSQWWFFWAFRCQGAQGRTVTFDFADRGPGPVGTRGPAVSLDEGRTWGYPCAKSFTTKSFTYTFPANATNVWFAQTILYTQRDWEAFVARHAADRAHFETGVLCVTDEGRAVEKARAGRLDGKAKYQIWLSARHHAQESTASFVLEGVLEAVLAKNELGAWLRDNVEFLVVPFVDKDGVEKGEQGKYRKPHDHNRDYDVFIHDETRAIANWIKTAKDLRIVLDIHCPWIRGQHNEWLYQVYKDSGPCAAAQARFGRLLEKYQRGGMDYRLSDDIPFGVGWNTKKNYSQGASFVHWAIKNLPQAELFTTYEVPFANVRGKTVTVAEFRELGEDTARVFRAFLTGEGAAPRRVSGIWPNLAMFNDEGECGTGAVVPWADRLWAITYAPHAPNGSSDKLYEVTKDHRQIVRPESVGGTPANRMIHTESGQLFIGPYVIDAKRNVRVIPPSKMYGRLTANMRHLTDPTNKIYYATMEEGFYEVDVRSLAVKEIYKDGNLQPGDLGGSLLPGYHGKGAYTGQGRVVYANNGERGAAALRDPTTTSGVLAQWDGKDWEVVLRNQFTEVTGPGGLRGNADPANDPLWSIGWDHRSLIFMILDGGTWHRYRLPKGSHSYDGAHGWNTEWPRIRTIGDGRRLMTMHGTFWEFPGTMRAANSAGLKPLSNYLKVIGDFCRWGEHVVFGCDDSAKSEFLNKRRAKGTIQGPRQSNSNLWFVKPDRLASFGPAIGRGAVWMREDARAGAPSDPYLLAGYDARALELAHGGAAPARFRLEIDRAGNGVWAAAGDVEAAPGVVTITNLDGIDGAWIRLVPFADTPGVTAFFQYANRDTRADKPAAMFAGLAPRGTAGALGGVVWSRGANLRTLGLAATRAGAGDTGFYELTEDLTLRLNADAGAARWARANYPFNGQGLEVDAASAVVTDDAGRRWRFPRADAAADGASVFGAARLCREACTERDLLNVCGTFYELPAENAGGFAKARAVATHNLEIQDYCTWRGLFVITGVDPAAKAGEHIIRSADGKAAVWVGAVDDLWELGKPRGTGGPWKGTHVAAGVPSDPYLMTGFDRKTLTLAQTGAEKARVTLEIDLTGDGDWRALKTYEVGSTPVTDDLSDVRAYWLRVRADTTCTATAQLDYR